MTTKEINNNNQLKVEFKGKRFTSEFYEDRKYVQNERRLISHLNNSLKNLDIQPTTNKMSVYDAFSKGARPAIYEFKIRSYSESKRGYDSHLLEKKKLTDCLAVANKHNIPMFYVTVEVFDEPTQYRADIFVYRPGAMDLTWQTLQCNKQTVFANNNKVAKEVTMLPKEDAVFKLSVVQTKFITKDK